LNLRGLLAAGVLLAVFAPAVRAPAADRLILRNLDILLDHTVKAFDEDGLLLDSPRKGGGDRITWDEVERGTIALDQPRFDALLKELGPPLYQIRQRLKIGDYESLAEPAELLYPLFAERKSQAAYMVCQATMWSRMALGQREAAVAPYLRCLVLLKSGAARSGNLPGNRRLEFELQTGISSGLLPAWFNADAAKAALPGVEEAIRGLSQPRPEGAYVYYASLAFAANDFAAAERVLNSIRGEAPAAANWRAIILAQQELSSGSPGPSTNDLRVAAHSYPDSCRPVALYFVGLADSQSPDEATCRDGILALLTLPAEYGRTQPELAAAGLYHAAAALDKLKDDRGAVAVRYELTSQYASTQYVARLRNESKPEP
jgi:hypothetical protein